ncbi:MAG: CBS domain-containing protein [Candidatus Hydrothermarchaeota archaeon]
MSVELTSVQREILLALIDLYRRKKSASVKGKDIASLTDKNPGTIRNQMQSLRALGLVEGVPGPKGGYRPTSKAYDALNICLIEKEVPVPISVEGIPFPNITVTEIDLTGVPHPEECKAEVYLIGDIKTIHIGERITIGPTPANKMRIHGTVIGRDDTENSLLIDIEWISSIPTVKVEELMEKEAVTLTTTDSIEYAINSFIKTKAHVLPVIEDKKIKGIVRIEEAFEKFGEKYETIEKILKPVVPIVYQETLLPDAMTVLFKQKTDCLFVLDENDNFKGLIGLWDLLKVIVSE